MSLDKYKLIDTQQSSQYWKAKYSQNQCKTSSLKEAMEAIGSL